MTEIPERVTFSIERDGVEYDVGVAHDLILREIGPDNVIDEAVAGWLQDHLTALSAVAHSKIEDLAPGDTHILIDTADFSE